MGKPLFYLPNVGAATFATAFAIGITTDERQLPKVTLIAGAVKSMLFTSFFSIFFCILHHKPKPSYDREKHPSNNLNMQFIAGSHVVSNMLPKLMEQSVMLIFILPPLCIHQTMICISCTYLIDILLMGYSSFTSFIHKLALSIYSNCHTTATPQTPLA